MRLVPMEEIRRRVKEAWALKNAPGIVGKTLCVDNDLYEWGRKVQTDPDQWKWIPPEGFNIVTLGQAEYDEDDDAYFFLVHNDEEGAFIVRYWDGYHAQVVLRSLAIDEVPVCILASVPL